MRNLTVSLFAALLLMLVFALLPVAAFAGVPPVDPAQAWWLAHASVVVLLYGIAHKFMPALKDWTNELIPWVGFIGGVLAQLVGAATPSVGAVVGALPHQSLATSVLHAGAGVIGAFLGHEAFLRPLAKLIGFKKPS